jgi:hypothetical protein
MMAAYTAHDAEGPKSACKNFWVLISDTPEHVDSENIKF